MTLPWFEQCPSGPSWSNSVLWRTFSPIVPSSCSINGQEKVRHDVMKVRQCPRRDPGLEDRREQLRLRPGHPVLQGQRGSVRQADDKPDRT